MQQMVHQSYMEEISSSDLGWGTSYLGLCFLWFFPSHSRWMPRSRSRSCLSFSFPGQCT